ncbi:MAG: pitrilysin family protein, partial [Thermoanaerobaculia bacterium]|nr:pitrilysin family protein [Thermoanaerobaculia bacterium]
MNRLRATLAAFALFVPALGLAPAPAAAQAQRPEDIQYPALPDFKLPKPERHVLPNGIVLLLAEDHELPLVRANVLIRTGSRLEAAEHAGLADLVGQTLRSGGTRNLTGDQIDEFLDGKGASIETLIDVHQGQASVFALKEDFPEVFRLFGEILRYPVFDPAKIDIAKTGVKGNISRQNDDPQDILYRELPELVYGAGSPYARQATYASLDAIEPADLVEFHRQYFQPTRLIIGVVGDFDAAEMRKLVSDTLGDWQATLPAGDPNMFSPPAKPAAGIYFIEKSDVTQSSIGMGDLGIVRRHPDYFAVEVMNQVLSGSFTSRLFSEVRTKKGLAYNVSGFVGTDWDKPGLTVLATSTKAETTGAAIDALLLEARRMKTEPPSDDEVAKAKRSILSSFIFQIDTPQKLLNQQLNYEYYGYPADWLEQYRLRIEKVTTAEVRDAAVKHLVPERFAILVVGPKEGRDTDLTKYGTVQTIDITIPEPNAPKLALTPEGQARA